MSTTPEFRKSSYSNHNQNCVECASLPDGSAAMQDTKNREAGYLSFPPAEWTAFLDDVKKFAE